MCLSTALSIPGTFHWADTTFLWGRHSAFTYRQGFFFDLNYWKEYFSASIRKSLSSLQDRAADIFKIQDSAERWGALHIPSTKISLFSVPFNHLTIDCRVMFCTRALRVLCVNHRMAGSSGSAGRTACSWTGRKVINTPRKNTGLLKKLPSNFLAPKSHWIFSNLIHAPFTAAFNLLFALGVIQTESVLQNTTVGSFNPSCPSACTGTDVDIFFWQTEG